jgi:hypothetical protein
MIIHVFVSNYIITVYLFKNNHYLENIINIQSHQLIIFSYIMTLTLIFIQIQLYPLPKIPILTLSLVFFTQIYIVPIISNFDHKL